LPEKVLSLARRVRRAARDLKESIMRGPSLIVPLALLMSGITALAAPPAGSGDAVDARIAKNVSSAAPPRPEPLFASSPTGKTESNAKSQADADLAARDAKPKLSIDRENLKGKSAAPTLQKGMSPANYDRSIQMGDKDHVQQATSLKIYLKPPPEQK
jgi:hypothetical protein